MKNELANIIRNQNIIHRKQKIFNIKNQTIFGYESLNRGPENSIYSNPLTLIDEAKQQDCYGHLRKLQDLKPLKM